MQMEQYQVVSSVGASPSQGQPLAVAATDQQQQQQVAVMQSLSGTPIAHVTTAQPQVRVPVMLAIVDMSEVRTIHWPTTNTSCAVVLQHPCDFLLSVLAIFLAL